MRITVIEHEAGAGLGFFEEWLGVPCEVVRPYLGESVPAHAPDGLIVLGGEASAWDDEGYPWLPATRDLLRTSVGNGTPTLGICLGAQLMTMACGGTVERGGDGLEIGAREVVALPEAAGDPLLGGLGRAVAVQYHQDAMTALPEGAVRLAAGDQYPNQAYRLGERAWAVQFHPEATPEIFAGWGADEELVVEVKRAAGALAEAWRPMAAAFARVVRDQAVRTSAPSAS
ncbi:type 1 glutamine amidotransferase [Nonomuraea africana]|uniref:GMP synthase-like glutamine amidotransferase n=1 Tax=Nonomuraea africana TaxID=46171 RepID=A0ABR9KI35_9ACTN|nr:type 1 glutamine amidotransferase [Nonomuraea africana]MBE1561676.1 GMP synthase-like glutamine amidotransferase [Nonomuraea africana]